jgi:hypothetical protein
VNHGPTTLAIILMATADTLTLKADPCGNSFPCAGTQENMVLYIQKMVKRVYVPPKSMSCILMLISILQGPHNSIVYQNFMVLQIQHSYV